MEKLFFNDQIFEIFLTFLHKAFETDGFKIVPMISNLHSIEVILMTSLYCFFLLIMEISLRSI